MVTRQPQISQSLRIKQETLMFQLFRNNDYRKNLAERFQLGVVGRISQAFEPGSVTAAPTACSATRLYEHFWDSLLVTNTGCRRTPKSTGQQLGSDQASQKVRL